MKEQKEQDSKLLRFHDLASSSETSSLKKYKRITVGDESYLYLLKCEIIQLLSSNVSGAAGIIVRQLLYRHLFKTMGRKTVIGRGVHLRQPHKISIGSGSIIEDYARIIVSGSSKAGIDIRNNVFLGPYSVFSSKDSYIEICDNTSIGSHCRIASMEGQIRIGQYVMVGAYCYIGGGNHSMQDLDRPMAKQSFESKGGVEIEDDVWLGANIVVLDGVKIMKGSVVGACSLVTRDIPPYSIAYGIPAKVHGSRAQQPMSRQQDAT